MKRFALALFALLVLSFALLSSVVAQPLEPPPFVFEACDGLAENDACTLDSPRGPIDGTCQTHPDGRLMCIPEGFGG
ncbi:MAG: hypothetical protein AAGF12_42305 [Myxococcota bacterium]